MIGRPLVDIMTGDSSKKSVDHWETIPRRLTDDKTPVNRRIGQRNIKLRYLDKKFVGLPKISEN